MTADIFDVGVLLLLRVLVLETVFNIWSEGDVRIRNFSS